MATPISPDSSNPWVRAELPIRLTNSNRLQRTICRAFLAAGFFGLAWAICWAIASGAPVGADGGPFLLGLLALITIMLCLRRAVRQDGYVELAVDRLTVSDGWRSETFLLAQCGEFKLHRLPSGDPVGIYWEGNKSRPVGEMVLTTLGILTGGVLSGLTSVRVLMGRRIAVRDDDLTALCEFLNRLRRDARSKQPTS